MNTTNNRNREDWFNCEGNYSNLLRVLRDCLTDDSRSLKNTDRSKAVFMRAEKFNHALKELSFYHVFISTKFLMGLVDYPTERTHKRVKQLLRLCNIKTEPYKRATKGINFRGFELLQIFKL